MYLSSVQLFAWRICVKTRLVSTKISDWHVRLERKHMCTAIILNKRNVCLWICLDNKRLAHWEDTSKHNKPMTIDSENGRKINTKTNFLSSFSNSGLGMSGFNSILWFSLSFYGKQTFDFCLFSLIDDLISAWRDHMSMAGGSMLLVESLDKTAFARVTLKRPIQARTETWEFTNKRALTEQDNSLGPKQPLRVFAHGKKKLSFSSGCYR